MKHKITLKSIVTNLDAFITGVTLSICVVLVNANVIMRYFANHPLQWCEEIVTCSCGPCLSAVPMRTASTHIWVWIS